MARTRRTARRAPPSPDATRDDALDPRRFAHDTIVTEERPEPGPDGTVAGKVTGLKVVTQTPLDRYLAHGHITPEQWWGGDQLRADFERADFDTTAQTRYDGMPSGGLRDITAVSVAACDARRAYIAAIRALPLRLSPVIVHVCCLRQYAADWAVAKRLPKAEGMSPASVNDAMRQMMADARAQWNDAAWFNYGSGIGPVSGPPSYVWVSGTQFKVAGADVRAAYAAGRRVRAVGSTTGTIYGTITASSFSTDTTVSVAWDSGAMVNEALAIALASVTPGSSPVPPVAPAAGLLTAVSATQIKFAPKNGGWVMQNGVLRPIPAAGVTAGNSSVFVNGASGQSLAPSTTYAVTLFDNAGTPTIDFKTTLTHAPSSTAGNVGTEIWNGDDTRSLIGLLYTNASSQFDDSPALRNVASWFNRRHKTAAGAVYSGITASTAFVEIGSGKRIETVTWADDDLWLGHGTNGSNDTSFGGAAANVGDGNTTAIFVDRMSTLNSPSDPTVTSMPVNLSFMLPFAPSEGHHIWYPLYRAISGGSASINGEMFGQVRN